MTRAKRLPGTSPRAAYVWAAVATTCVLLAPSFAWATRIKAEAVTLEYQVLNSDVIVRGKCVGSTTEWVNNHIFTTYKIQATKYVKTPGKKFAQDNPVLTVTQLGGRLSSPIPLEESYPNRATMFVGEDVVLFLRSPSSVPAGMRKKHDEYVQQGIMKPSPMMQNYTLTTLDVSKMTFVKDPRSGKELVTRISLARPGLATSPEMARRAVEAFEAGQDSITLRQGERTYRVQVRAGRLAFDRDSMVPASSSAPTLEQKVARMSSFSSTWEDFETEVQAILAKHAEKSGSLSEEGKGVSQP